MIVCNSLLFGRRGTPHVEDTRNPEQSEQHDSMYRNSIRDSSMSVSVAIGSSFDLVGAMRDLDSRRQHP